VLRSGLSFSREVYPSWNISNDHRNLADGSAGEAAFTALASAAGWNVNGLQPCVEEVMTLTSWVFSNGQDMKTTSPSFSLRTRLLFHSTTLSKSQ